MFPYTRAFDVPEVTRFMAGLGATQTWTNSIYPYDEYHPSLIHWVQFGDPGVPVRTPADAIATWRISEEERATSRNIDTWVGALVNMTPDHGFYGTELGISQHRFMLLDQVANVLAGFGYDRAITAAAVGLFVYADRRNRHNFTATTVHDLRACAKIASFGDALTFEQKIDCIWQQLPLAEIETLLATGTPYSMIRELFPTPVDPGRR